MAVTLRTYTLTIGKPVYMSKDKKTNINEYVNQKDEANALVIKDLNIEFSLKKDNSKDPNKGYVTVYNLSQDSVNFLDAGQGENLAVIFTAGYDGDEKMVFSGTVEFMQDSWEGPTRKTKFILGDAVVNITQALSARSYTKGTPLNRVLNDLLDDMGLPKGRVIPFDSSQTLSYSVAYNGSTAQNLQSLATNTGSTFSVQDGAVYWTKQGSRLKDVVYEISAETGMKDSPTPKNPNVAKKKKKKKSAKKEDAGLTVTTLLNGAIIPESTVYLNSEKYKGYYKVIYLTHKGEFEGDSWDTELGLADINAVVKSE